MLAYAAVLSRCGGEYVVRIPRNPVRWMGAVTCVGFLLRLPYLLLATPTDEGFFLYGGRYILGGCEPYVCYFMDHPPLFQYSVAGVYKLAGVGMFQGKLLPFTMSVLSVWIIYSIGARMFSPQAGLVSASLFALTPGIAYFGASANQYSGPIFFFLSALALAQRGGQGGGRWWLIASGVSLALSSMIRLFAPVFLVSYVIVALVKCRGNLMSAAYMVVGFVVGFLALNLLFYSPQMFEQVYLVHTRAGNWSLVEKIYSTFSVALPYHLPTAAFFAWAVQSRRFPQGVLAGALYLNAFICLGLVFALKYSDHVNPVMYLTYAGASMSLIGGQVGEVLDGRRFSRVGVFAVLFSLVFAPHLLNAYEAHRYTNSAADAAGYVEQGAPFIGDPFVALKSGGWYETTLFFHSAKHIREGKVTRENLAELPQGTVYAAPKAGEGFDKRVYNVSLSDYERVYENGGFTVYKKIR